MTCIVGIKAGEKITIGGDSFGGSQYHHQKVSDPKVFMSEVDCAGEESEYLVMGGCGSFRMLQLLKYALQIPKFDPDMSINEWMVEAFAESCRTLFKDRGLTQLYHEQEEQFAGVFLIGFRGSLFTLQEDFAVIGWTNEEHATGAGEEYALGSLASTRGRIKSPKTRIKIALDASAEFSPMVVPPYAFVTTEGESGWLK